MKKKLQYLASRRLGSDHHSLRSGFTLIELMIYMGLLTIFMFIMTDLLTQILDVRTQSTALSFVTSDGNFLKDRFAYDIRRSSAISNPATVNASSDQLSVVIMGVTSTFRVLDDSLVLTRNGTSAALTSSDVSVASFSATRLGNGTGKDTVKLEYTLTSKRTSHNLPVEAESFALTIGAR